jgi:hypothetical protein
MYERFTDRARRVMRQADEEARRLQHKHVGTEHVLLGLLKEGSGDAANVLSALGVEYRVVRLEVEKTVPSAPEAVTMGKLPQTPRAKAVIEYAIKWARDLDHQYVGTEHLLLGLLREQEGVAAQVLRNLGLKLEDVRERVLRTMGVEAPAPDAITASPSPPAGADLYAGFTGQARTAVQLAHREAQRLNQEYVGTEHLLLGVLREPGEGAARLLRACGTDPDTVYREVEPHLPRGNLLPSGDKLPLTPSARRVFDHARQEALVLRHDCVGPEHLLLGLFREPEGSASHLLAPLGLSPEALRAELAKLPAPENRDWMLRPEPTPGALPAPADPSPAELGAVVTEEVLPGVAPAEDRGRMAWRRAEPSSRLLRRGDAELDLPVVEKQLRFTQFVVAAVAGGVAGGLLRGFGGALIGWFVGVVLAALRSGLLGAVVGFAAGAGCGWAAYPRRPGAGLLGALVGLALGACLGDWRKLRAPPGSG